MTPNLRNRPRGGICPKVVFFLTTCKVTLGVTVLTSPCVPPMSWSMAKSDTEQYNTNVFLVFLSQGKKRPYSEEPRGNVWPTEAFG